MSNWFTDLFKDTSVPQYPTGALITHETAPIVFSDVVATANAVDWNKSTYRSFPKLNQNRSNMCGAFGSRKNAGICYAQRYGNYIDFSEEDIYQRRQNKGQAGMYLPDIISILQSGVTLKALTNVDVQTDADADNCVIEDWKHDVGKSFAISQGIYIPSGDFETIASVIQTTGKAVMGLMYFTYQEWSLQYPQVFVPGMTYDDSRSLHHFINFTDLVTINGVKYLVVEDSAWFGGYSTRFVSKEFLQARNIPVSMANAYIMNFKFQVTDMTKAHFVGTIVSLQQCLQTLGFFPTNVSFIENVGPTTRGALVKFQTTYGLTPSGSFDDATRALITRLFP